jgi:hypothetical protein
MDPCRAIRAAVVAAVVTSWLGGASPARACSLAPPSSPTAIPRTGTTNVSTATSLVVLSPSEPFGLSLLVNGQPRTLFGWTALGRGVDDLLGATSFWQLQIDASSSMLDAGAEYTLSLSAGDAGVGDLTDFTTAAGYDKNPGTPPNLRALHLWRVRYPVGDIASGNCVFAEYQSFITIDYDPATVPNTAPSSVIHVFGLSPKTGGAQQTFVFTGSSVFTGLAPSGDYPLPLGQWQPDLDPTREYCLGISAFGDGDLARGRLSSNAVCATVTQLAATGATLSPTTGDAGSGCSAAGTFHVRESLSLTALSLLVIGWAALRHLRVSVGYSRWRRRGGRR